MITLVTWYSTDIKRIGYRRSHEMSVDVGRKSILLIQIVNFESKLLVVVNGLDPVPSVVTDRVGIAELLFDVESLVVAKVTRHNHLAVVQLQ